MNDPVAIPSVLISSLGSTLPAVPIHVSAEALPMLQSFAHLFLLLVLISIPTFALGLLAGWFQWNFLANLKIDGLEKQNAALRDELRFATFSPGTTP